MEYEKRIGRLSQFLKEQRLNPLRIPGVPELLKEEKGAFMLSMKTVFASAGTGIMLLGAYVLSDGIQHQDNVGLAVGTVISLSGLTVTLVSSQLDRLREP